MRFLLAAIAAMCIATAGCSPARVGGVSPSPESSPPPSGRALPSDTYKIVAYGAPWCGACRRDVPYLLVLASRGYNVEHVDTSGSGMRIPFYEVFQNGEKVFSTSNVHEIE